jgi:hypothetical protein
MPPKLVEIAKQFAEKFLPDALRDIPVSQQSDLVDMYPCEINWNQTSIEKFVQDTINCITNTMASLTPADQLAIADITVIVDSIEIGIKIRDALAEKSIKCIDTFSIEKNGDDRRKKIAFYTGGPSIKLTTIHSYKGFESRLLILAIHKANDATNH